jgi:integrase
MAANDDSFSQIVLPIGADEIGRAVNAAAARTLFADYRSRLAENTRRRHDADLASFGDFLVDAGLRRYPGANHPEGLDELGNLSADPQAWKGLTWGMVQAFRAWLLHQGYALGTVNLRLSTVRTYARLAMQAGAIPDSEALRIREVKGYAHREATRIDEARRAADTPTRLGLKKAEPARMSESQAHQLKHLPGNTPTDRRDNLLMCLLLDHGLRVGEVVRLRTEDVDMQSGILRFLRPKVSRVQRHKLSGDTLEALQKLLARGEVERPGPLLRRMEKDGQPGRGLSVSGANYRVGELGRLVGIDNLSPHDCRHYWATLAAASGTDPFALQEAGGWASLAMPRRYVEEQKIANQRVHLARAAHHDEG